MARAKYRERSGLDEPFVFVLASIGSVVFGVTMDMFLQNTSPVTRDFAKSDKDCPFRINRRNAYRIVIRHLR